MLVSENRPEWLISDLAIMAAGCVTVPTYITNTERDHQHILDDSGARAVIVSTQKLARTLLPGRDPLQRVRACDRHRAAARRPGRQLSSFHDWDALIAAESADAGRLRRRRRISRAATSPASSTRRAPAARRAA